MSPLETQQQWIKRAIELAVQNVRAGNGGPFGALVVRSDEVLATGVNLVTATNDPTAHAEVVAIRAACQGLGTFQLAGCEIYTSCEPCPMCLGAMYWARPARFFYAASRADAAACGFDDAFIYEELVHPPDRRTIQGAHVPVEGNRRPFEEWIASLRKVPY